MSFWIDNEGIGEVIWSSSSVFDLIVRFSSVLLNSGGSLPLPSSPPTTYVRGRFIHPQTPRMAGYGETVQNLTSTMALMGSITGYRTDLATLHSLRFFWTSQNQALRVTPPEIACE